MKYFLLVLICVFLLTACGSATSVPIIEATQPTPIVVNTVQPSSIWMAPSLPVSLSKRVVDSGIPLAKDLQSSTLHVDISDSGTIWIYALVAPFPTLVDDVTYADLLSTWKGASSGPLSGRVLLLADSTLAAFTAIWGEPASSAVRSVPSDQLLDAAWKDKSSWAIIPFEEIQPKWKVISVDGQSPIRKSFISEDYPLKVYFSVTGNASFTLPESNRDPKKLATVVMTGVTALTRATAKKMNQKGFTYPGEVLRDMFLEADILHINNEVPFYAACPQPDPFQPIEIFCSAPRNIKLLTDIGTDVMELSGDHLADYGEPAMLETINIYKENNIPYYGGGINEEDGKKPLFFEVNGNKIMFIGCDYKTIYAKARENRAGSVRCDFDYITGQIREYRAQGYLPVVTFQYNEFDSPEARPQQIIDFRTMADAGAVVVSGSQAHVPQVMEFYKDSFIHYGLGNLFFDQMGREGSRITQHEFIDRHVFYDGKYLGVELITAYLEDYSRPRYMTEVERNNFLTLIFNLGGWDITEAAH